jgi:hypothetical protein
MLESAQYRQQNRIRLRRRVFGEVSAVRLIKGGTEAESNLTAQRREHHDENY